MPFAKRIASAAFGAIALLAAAARPAHEPPPPLDPTALLRASVDAPKTVSYVGQFETVRFSSSHAVATIVKVEHRSPEETRRWYVAPDALYGDYVIQRGTAVYEFDTKHDKVTVTHNPLLDDQVATADNFDRVLENYRAIDDGPGMIAEHPTDSVELVNKYTGERAIRVWLDAKTHLVLKKEAYHGNGAVASQTLFDDLRYTTSIPEAVFSTALPAGFSEQNGTELSMPSTDMDRTIKDAGFKPYTPKDLPQGFVLTSSAVDTVARPGTGSTSGSGGGVRTLHLLYSDGLRSISLFENSTGASADFGNLHPKTIRFSDHDASYVEEGPTTLITWNEHGLHFAMVGDLLLPELVAIGKSVVP
jgi:negative regulator of sigma E activity